MSNEIKTRPLTPTEQKYTYAQSMQLEGQTGTIGHLRGDFATEHCHKLNEQLQTWLLSLIFNRLKMSWVIIYNTSKLLSGQTFCCPCFLDCLSYRCKIEVKIIVSCVHKLTTLYLQNATVIFYRNVSSYRTV